MYPTPTSRPLGGVRRLRRIQRRGVWLVFTARSGTRVHVSPMIMMVAVPVSRSSTRPGWGCRLLAHRGQPQTARPRRSARTCPRRAALAQPWGLRQARGRPGTEPSPGRPPKRTWGHALAALGGGTSTPPSSPAAPGARTRHPTLPGARAPPARTRRGRDPHRRPNRRLGGARATGRPATPAARRDSSYRAEDEDAGSVAQHRCAGRATRAGRAETRRGGGHEIRSRGGRTSPPRDTART